MTDLFPNGAKTSRPVGDITDRSGNMLLKMWNAEVPSGKHLFQRHSHISFEITMVDNGSGIYTTREAAYPMEPGDLFIFSSNEYHCITEVGQKGLGLTNLHFEPRYLWGDLNHSFSEENLNLCFFHSKSFQNRIPAAQSTDLRRAMEEIRRELTGRGPEYPLAVRSQLNLLLIRLVREFHYLDPSAPHRVNPRNLQQILTYIDEHFTERLTLEELSALAGMSPNYFSSYFKKLSGIHLWDYISSKRVDLAARMIRDQENEKNMLEIATLTGFNNTANFNKIFKRITGMTPSEYRKNTGLMIH